MAASHAQGRAVAPRRFRSHLVGAVLAYVEARGGDVNVLCKAAGLSREIAREPWVDLPLEALHRLLNDAAAAADDPNLGLNVAARLPRDTWDLLQLASMSAPTLGDALHELSRLLPLFNHEVELVVRAERARLWVEHRIAGCSSGLSRHGNELWLAAVLTRARDATGAALIPRRCWFGHARPPDISALSAALGTRAITFGAGATGFELEPAAANLPLLTADPVLRGVLERLSAAQLAVTEGQRGVPAELARWLDENLRERVPPVSHAARAMAMSTRSLQRALREHHTSYRALVDQARQRRARDLLNRGARLDDAARDLGYSETSALVRALRRWGGEG